MSIVFAKYFLTLTDLCEFSYYKKIFGHTNAKKKIGVYMKKVLCVILLLFVFTLGVSPFCLSFSKFGSRGSEVEQIQLRLSTLGYYKGAIDGIYGSATEKAVKEFQYDNSLVSDGIAGEKTLAALGISSSNSSYSENEYLLLARLISAEARGESYEGQVAVGAVVLNRVEHPSFPDTISGVIYQKGAFSCLYDGQFDKPVSAMSYSAARDALNGLDPSGGAIYYFNPATATNKWIWSRPAITTIGNHIFCE